MEITILTQQELEEICQLLANPFLGEDDRLMFALKLCREGKTIKVIAEN